MRQFFLDLLNNLDKLAGLRQAEKIYASHDDPAEAKKEISQLITVLVSVADQFTTIPEEHKQRIIRNAVMTDPEFTSLNARIVYKWLNGQKDKFYKELAHQPTVIKEEDKPIPKDDPRYDDYCEQWKKALAPMEERINITAKREVTILGHERQGRTNYTPLSDEEVIQRENHRRELAEQYWRERHPGATEEQVKEFLESL